MEKLLCRHFGRDEAASRGRLINIMEIVIGSTDSFAGGNDGENGLFVTGAAWRRHRTDDLSQPRSDDRVWNSKPDVGNSINNVIAGRVDISRAVNETMVAPPPKSPLSASTLVNGVSAPTVAFALFPKNNNERTIRRVTNAIDFIYALCLTELAQTAQPLPTNAETRRANLQARLFSLLLSKISLNRQPVINPCSIDPRPQRHLRPWISGGNQYYPHCDAFMRPPPSPNSRVDGADRIM